MSENNVSAQASSDRVVTTAEAAGESVVAAGAPQQRRRVLIAACGGIAVYKACEVLRGLQRAGCDVRVVMTEDAQRFVGRTTFAALSGHDVACDLYGYAESAIPHIALSGWAELAIVVPATANVMAKMAAGLADEVVSSTLLACACPVLVAPAMNTRMWSNAATQANVRTLGERGVLFVLPEEGRLACGDEGAGKLAAVDDIVARALAVLNEGMAAGAAGVSEAEGASLVGRLAGRHIVITAGPTHEAIDPVRFIANASTGKMGYAIAREAVNEGAQVTLVSGPVSIEAPQGCDVVRVVSALQMHEATTRAFKQADAAICTAAVADYRPVRAADHKLKKGAEQLDAIQLVENPDILAEIASVRGDRVVVGFAAETNDLIANAQAKLRRKACDLIVVNDVSRPDSTFGADTSRIAFVSEKGVEQLETMPLSEVAKAICAKLAQLLG